MIINPNTSRHDILAHLGRCRACSALFAHARRAGDLSALGTWRRLIAEHLHGERERRDSETQVRAMVRFAGRAIMMVAILVCSACGVFLTPEQQRAVIAGSAAFSRGVNEAQPPPPTVYVVPPPRSTSSWTGEPASRRARVRPAPALVALSSPMLPGLRSGALSRGLSLTGSAAPPICPASPPRRYSPTRTLAHDGKRCACGRVTRRGHFALDGDGRVTR